MLGIVWDLRSAPANVLAGPLVAEADTVQERANNAA